MKDLVDSLTIYTWIFYAHVSQMHEHIVCQKNQIIVFLFIMYNNYKYI